MSYVITHLGGEQTVTGSCHLLQVKDVNILVDCGTAQGTERVMPMNEWPVLPSEIDYLFLTHAHIDHIGRVPELIQHGFVGEIITTEATLALMPSMFEDAMGFSHIPKVQSQQILEAIEEFTWDFEYDQSYDLRNGVRFKLGRAGHILGSCFIRFEWDDPAFSVVFSGDVGATHTPILPDPDVPDPCDLLIMESTYGDRCHEDRQERTRRLGEALTRALKDGGKVFIPAFTLGRTQELVYEMDRLFSDPGWQEAFPALTDAKTKIPIIIDSPLGLKITDIYSRLSDFWDQEAQEIFRSGDHPLQFSHLYSIKNFQEHERLLTMPGPAVIIAGSGMCTGGRIVNHLYEGLRQPKNDVFFVGYQAEGTPGREIISFAQRPGGFVRFKGQKVFIKANIHMLSGYSAHADQQDLLNWVQAIPEKPSMIKLIHGAPEAQNILRNKLIEKGYQVVSTLDTDD